MYFILYILTVSSLIDPHMSYKTQSLNNNTGKKLMTNLSSNQINQLKSPLLLQLKTTDLKEEQEDTNSRLNNPPEVVDDKGKECTIKDYHSPYSDSEAESFEMKAFSILFIIIFSGSVILGLLLTHYIHRNSNSFFKTAFSDLITESTYLLMVIWFASFLYLIRAFDNVLLNWQYIISGMFVFCLFWLFCCALVICISWFVVLKWQELERNSRSFKHIKLKYEKNCLQTPEGNGVNREKEYYFELFEFLIMKVYFIIPFFPVFKPSVFNANFSMSRYLKICLLEKLGMLFKISWTAWVVTIIVILTWNVLLPNTELQTQVIVLMVYPLIGILVLLLSYFYFKRVFRRTVGAVTEDNYLEFKDIEEYSQNYATEKFLNYPIYLESIINKPAEAKVAKINYHSHIHNRTSSFYEDTIAFGATGFYIFFNIVQSVFLVFAVWLCFVCLDIIPKLFGDYPEYVPSALSIFFIITTVCFYAFLHCYLVAITLRWYTVISSTEMKRNEKCLDQCIEEEIQEASEMSESVFRSFKRLYYDMRIKTKETQEGDSKFNSLPKPAMRKMLMSTILKFKGVKSLDELNEITAEEDKLIKNNKEITIDFADELRLFIKTAGNELTTEDIDFMLHMIENFEKYQMGRSISQSQLFEIWAVMIHFSGKRPDEVYSYVFQKYFDERIELLNTNKFNEEGLLEFFRWYQEYFSSLQMEFIEKQIVSIMGKNKEVSIDYFIANLISLRKYHRN